MVEYNDFRQVQWLLQERFGQNVASLILPFLHIFIKDWHIDPPRLWLKPHRLEFGDVHKPGVAIWKAYSVTFATTEQFYRMRQMNFQLTLFHPILFSPPYSDLLLLWQKEVGMERAKELVKLYSYDPDHITEDLVWESFFNGFSWTQRGSMYMEQAFIEHSKDVVLSFELIEIEKTEVDPPCTIFVKNAKAFFDAVQKLHRKAYTPRIRKRKQQPVIRDSCLFTGRRPLKDLRDLL